MGRDRKIDRSAARVKDLDEVMLQRCAGIVTTPEHLANLQIRNIIVLDGALALTVEHSPSGHVRHVHKESFIWLDQFVAVHRYVERVG